LAAKGQIHSRAGKHFIKGVKVSIMLLAIGYHLRRHESPVASCILFLLAVFVLFGRFSHCT